MAKDLVCGAEVDPKVATGKSVHKGQTYYFDTLDCKKKFDKDPEKYINQQNSSPEQQQQREHHQHN